MITDDYVSFELAKKLKEKGFDGKCNSYYDTIHQNVMDTPISCLSYYDWNHKITNFCEYSAPTLSLVQKWFRKKYNKHISPEVDYYNHWGCIIYPMQRTHCPEPKEARHEEGAVCNFDEVIRLGGYSSYEEALEAGINKALELIL